MRVNLAAAASGSSLDIIEQVFGDAGGLGRYILSGVATAFACLGLTIVATQLLARRLQRDVTGPLAHIAQVAHAVRTDRQFDQRVPVAAQAAHLSWRGAFRSRASGLRARSQESAVHAAS